MIWKDLLNINNLKNKDIFNIRSFIIVFSIYSLISIWSSDAIYTNSLEIQTLREKQKNIKQEYIDTRTILMTISRESYLLEKAEGFGLIKSQHPPHIIYLSDEY